jgi:hypothetical protein
VVCFLETIQTSQLAAVHEQLPKGRQSPFPQQICNQTNFLQSLKSAIIRWVECRRGFLFPCIIQHIANSVSHYPRYSHFDILNLPSGMRFSYLALVRYYDHSRPSLFYALALGRHNCFLLVDTSEQSRASLACKALWRTNKRFLLAPLDHRFIDSGRLGLGSPGFVSSVIGCIVLCIWWIFFLVFSGLCYGG